MALRVFVSVVTLLLTLCNASFADSNAQQVQCAPYVFLGMSGSGQKADENESGLIRELGPEIASLYDEIRKIPEFKEKIFYDPIPSYKAIGVPGYSKNLWDDISKFLEGLRSNSTESLLSRFLEYTKACPDSKFIIAGYSQGAFAAHYLVTQLEKAQADQINRVLAVFLLANPATPKQGIVPFFDAETRKSRVIKTFSTGWWTAFCAALRVTSYYQSCLDVSGEKIADLQIKESLPEPKLIKVFSYHSRLDLVADTARVFSASNLTREVLSVRNLKKSGSIVPSKSGLVGEVTLGISNAAIKARDIHSSYCAPVGEFAPKTKVKRDKCNAKSHAEFVQGSLKYLRQQLTSS